MFKKKIILVLAVVLLVVPVLLVPVSAANTFKAVSYRDIYSELYSANGYNFYTFSAPVKSYSAYGWRNSTGEIGESIEGAASMADYFYTGINKSITFRNFYNGTVLRVNDIPNYTQMTIKIIYSAWSLIGETAYTHPIAQIGITYLDTNYNAVKTQKYEFGQDYDTGVLQCDMIMDIPSNAQYCRFYVVWSHIKSLTVNENPIMWEILDWTMKIGVPVQAVEDAEEQDRHNQIVDQNNQMIDQNDTIIDQNDQMIDQNDTIIDQNDQMIDQMETLPGEIGNEIQGVIDKEDQEAQQSGEGAAGEIMDIVPDESQGFMNALGSLVGALSYNGTAAKLPVPAIVLPAIPGVMDELKLTDKLEVDFGYWVQQIPGDVIEIVQIICTIALIVYCFKELYSTISYAMTLKGGGNE